MTRHHELHGRPAPTARRTRASMSSTHIAGWSAALSVLLGLSACESSTSNGHSYELGPSECQLTSSLSGPSGTTWSGCEMSFDASNVTYTWVLMPPGTSGSILSPGNGWIVMTLDANSPENATLSLSGQISTMPASVPIDQIVFVYGTSGGRMGGTGSVAVGSNVVNINGLGGDLAGQMNVRLMDGTTISGSFSAHAAAAGAGGGGGGGGSGGGGGGGGGGSCSAARQQTCQNLTSQCSSCGGAPACQQACYCAAACDCACAGNTSCEQSNRASALMYGPACSY